MGNNHRTLIAAIALGITIVGTVIGVYTSLDRYAREKPSEERVAQIIEWKLNGFSGAIAEILRRLERIERQQDAVVETLARREQKR